MDLKLQLYFFKGGTVTCYFTAKKLATGTDWNKLNNLNFIPSEYTPLIETEVVQKIDIPRNSNNYGVIKWKIKTNGEIYYKQYSGILTPTSVEVLLTWMR